MAGGDLRQATLIGAVLVGAALVPVAFLATGRGGEGALLAALAVAFALVGAPVAAALPERLPVSEALQLFATSRAHKGDDLLEQFRLVQRRKSAFASLSGGERQRLFLVLALLNRPRMVILDERERAASLGGTCEAGPSGTGWRVQAELPPRARSVR
ncbi:MAG: ATP-binding cassette domain-containing protein [Nocardioidaceae bacterium]